MSHYTAAPILSNQPTHLMPTYNRQPIAFVRGKGAYLYTEDGSEYLDALSGIAVCGLGHAHPVLAQVIAEQANTLIHTSNLYEIPWQTAAAQKLAKVSGMEEIFFANSGAEANEAAIKIARKYANDRGIRHGKIIVAEKSFHGRTLATLSATGNEKVQQGFAPLLEDFLRVPYGDITAITKLAEHHDIVAILVEPIQGEGGINTAPQGFSYLQQLRDLCNQHAWLLMLDEIQTGNGRTGRYFAYQHSSILPDVVTTAKGLGNGFPIGAVMVSGKATGILSTGNHGSTYGGTVLGSRVVYSVIEIMEKENIIENAAQIGQYLLEQFSSRLAAYPITVRGFGMMIGIELPKDCTVLVEQACNEKHLIINVTAGNVVRLLPPLNLTLAQADLLLDRLIPLIQAFLDEI